MPRMNQQARKPGTGPVPGKRVGPGAVDHIAAATGVMVAALGLWQMFAPLLATPFTGIEPGMAGQILGLQWAVFGALLALGGVLRTRVLTIFAGEFVALSALAALAVFLINQRGIESVLIYCLIAGLGFASSGVARLTDKAELRREIKLLREQAASRVAQAQQAKVDDPGV